ncbi:hypothetical protein G7Y41_02950 [Schaalia sp. ZJ405]|uniref:hypothetical protein n=1 Tax=Schaalia sp. ZJ405 TaxID=2709403 RepID=UPI0013EA09C8|nr:hypothetical protein [Schaalia sp. ZJ405]QPK81801.1 hypothetical protein G7Y41_02950 [Schaalia sp. ZJ405]
MWNGCSDPAQPGGGTFHRHESSHTRFVTTRQRVAPSEIFTMIDEDEADFAFRMIRRKREAL